MLADVIRYMCAQVQHAVSERRNTVCIYLFLYPYSQWLENDLCVSPGRCGVLTLLQGLIWKSLEVFSTDKIPCDEEVCLVGKMPCLFLMINI